MSCPTTSSGEKSADAQISTQPGRLQGIDINPPAANSSTLKIYDSNNSTLSGKLLLRTITIPAGVASINLSDLDIVVNQGIYADLGGDATTYIVHYSLG